MEIIKGKNRDWPVYIRFMGAVMEESEDPHTTEYRPRGEIYVSVQTIQGYYDHTLLTKRSKIRIMETAEEIREKIDEAGRALGIN